MVMVKGPLTLDLQLYPLPRPKTLDQKFIMLKKYLLCLLAVVSVLAVAGCGKKSAPPPSATPQASSSPAERPVDPALLDDGLDEALKELDAVE